MSFGFSASDFITVIQLANKIRKEFRDAPSQFKSVSDEVRNLSFVLQDADVAFSNRDIDNEQKNNLEDIEKSCRNILSEPQQILDKNLELSFESGGVGKRIQRVWKRLNWKPEDIDQLRSRVITNITLLNAFNGQLTQDSVVKLVRHQEDQGRQTVLNWLTPIGFATQQSDFISRREAGTGQWLLKSAEFQAWVKTSRCCSVREFLERERQFSAQLWSTVYMPISRKRRILASHIYTYLPINIIGCVRNGRQELSWVCSLHRVLVPYIVVRVLVVHVVVF